MPKAVSGSRVPEEGVGVLEDEVAGSYGEVGVEGLVGADDLDVAGAGKRRRRILREKVRSWSGRGGSSGSARRM